MFTRILRSPRFWVPLLVTLLPTGLFLAWELQLISGPIPLPRSEVTMLEWIFAGAVVLLLPLNIGLAFWQARYGQCPRGTKRASGIAGLIGTLTLLCPVCIALPAAFLGVGAVLAFLTPFLPLLRLIAVILLAVAAWMLRPKGS